MKQITRDELLSTAAEGVYLLGDHREHDRVYSPLTDGWQEGPTSLYGRVDAQQTLPSGADHAEFRADGKRVIIVRAVDGTVSEG